MDIDGLMNNFGPIKEAMDKADAERKEARLEGSAGGGAVRVVLRGDLQIERVTIAPAAAAVSADDISMLEDLVQVACNDALNRYRQQFGSSPEEQLQKTMQDSGLASLLGPLMGGLGG